MLRLVSMADSRNERLCVLIGIDYDSIAPGVIRTKLPASIRPSFIAFFFFNGASNFMYKKYYMEQSHYNPKIRVMKRYDKNVSIRSSSMGWDVTI